VIASDLKQWVGPTVSSSGRPLVIALDTAFRVA
jgi:hypothetical protein